MNQHLGERRLTLGDLVALGGELGVVVVNVGDAHHGLVAFDLTGDGGALQDERVGDNVGRREGVDIGPPRARDVGGHCGMSHEAQPFSQGAAFSHAE